MLVSVSVADPGCLSLVRLFSIPDPNCFHPGSRVSDPYSFFTDPDPDPEDPDGGQYGSGSGSNPDPGL